MTLTNEIISVCYRMTLPHPLPTTVAGKFRHAVVFLRSIINRIGPIVLADARFCHLVIHRIGRMNTRLAALAAKFDAGTLPPPAPPRPRSAPADPAPARKPVDRSDALPTRFGWMLHWIQGVVHPRTIIENLLVDAQFKALLAAAPQAGRILRPLCHMLGIPRPAILDLPAILDRPARPEKPRPTSTRSTRRKARRPKPARSEPAPPEPTRQPAPATRPHWPPTQQPPPPRPFRTIPELRHLWGRLPPQETA